MAAPAGAASSRAASIVLLLASVLGGGPAFAQTGTAGGACGAELAGAQRAESARHVVFWRADPQKIPVGRHFAVDIVVCPRSGAPAAPAISGIAIDARMPAHGHGMNYKPSVKATADNRYRAEGLLFHMGGQWEMVFELRTADKPERATQAVTVR